MRTLISSSLRQSQKRLFPSSVLLSFSPLPVELLSTKVGVKSVDSALERHFDPGPEQNVPRS